MLRSGSASDRQKELPLGLGVHGGETATGARREDAPVEGTKLMEQVLELENLQRALDQVRRNRGAPGIDGMTVDALGEHLKKHWSDFRTSLVEGTYEPQPVRRVEIPKPGGGVRKLGVPVVVDRFIEQAILQVLQQQWDGSFSERSYGFRPERSPHQAIAKAQEYILEGYTWVVDIDLEKFFDRVNHDKLMSLVKKRVKDPRVIGLIHRYLKAGAMSLDGKVEPTPEGTPQGASFSAVEQSTFR